MASKPQNDQGEPSDDESQKNEGAPPADDELTPDERSAPKRGARENATSIGKMIAYSHVAYMFIGAFALPTALGIWLDAEAGTRPWGVIGGVSLGFVLSMVVAWREVMTTGTRLSEKRPPTRKRSS